MNFEDLATIVDGIVNDNVNDNAIELKAFRMDFTQENILGLWAKVRFVPFTRACAKKVQHKLGQQERDE
jgi:hypothetical protein